MLAIESTYLANFLHGIRGISLLDIFQSVLDLCFSGKSTSNLRCAMRSRTNVKLTRHVQRHFTHVVGAGVSNSFLVSYNYFFYTAYF